MIGDSFAEALEKLEGFIEENASEIISNSSMTGGFSVAVGKGAFSGIIMRRDAQCELGGSGVESSVALMFREVPFASASDKVRVMGSPLHKLRRGASAPCAVSITVTASEFLQEDFERLIDALRSPDYTDGCMMQMSIGMFRMRISKQAVKSGLNLQQLGSALVQIVHDALPVATGVDVLLVCGDEAAVRKFRQVGDVARQAGHGLRKALYANRGVDLDCASGISHCGSCKDKEVCTTVRHMEHLRKVNRKFTIV